MHQFVQSAIEAANQGDKTKAMEFIKQVVAANPNDVDAWLVLAALVDEPERKHQCLKRVLAMDPINQLARDELFEMDRIAMGGEPSSDLEPMSAVVPEVIEPPTKPAQPTGERASNPKSLPKTPLVFQMSLAVRLSLYFITVLVLITSFVAIFNFKIGIFLLLFFIFIAMCLIAWYYSWQIKVSEKGLIVDSLIKQARIGWNEISEIKAGSSQRGMELIRKKGKPVKVTGAVSGYQTLVEILRQRRPDLFDDVN